MTDLSFAEKAPDVVDAHINYLNRVIDYVEGKIPDPQATAHDKCVLRRWYYETAPRQPAYGSHTKYQELGLLHAAFHAACEDAVRHRDRGDLDSSRSAIIGAKDLSVQICEALIEILGL